MRGFKLGQTIKKSIKVVEKKNHLACHGIFNSVESAKNHLENTIPEYVRKGYFMEKTLASQDFEIVVS